MSQISDHLANALDWKFGGDYGDTAGEVITAWRHETLPQPDPATVVAEYLAHLAADEPRRLAVSRAALIFARLADRYAALSKDRDAQIALILDQLCNKINNPTAQMAEYRTQYAAAAADVQAAIAARRA